MSGIIAQNSGRHTGLVKASSGGGGVWNLILTQTASSSAALSFTSGLDSTYDEYIFTFINLHPETDDRGLMVGFRDGSTDYDAIKTTSKWRAYHAEADDAAVLSYDSDYDQHQATGFQQFDDDIGNDNDQVYLVICIFLRHRTQLLQNILQQKHNQFVLTITLCILLWLDIVIQQQQ